MISESDWKWYGNHGHLIVGRDCRFHLCTEIGEYVISTVGEYLPDAPVREILADTRGVKLSGRGDERLCDYMKQIGYETVGFNRLYETMVFKFVGRCQTDGCGCGLPSITGEELDFAGYNDAKAATQGHYALCKKYAQVS